MNHLWHGRQQSYSFNSEMSEGFSNDGCLFTFADGQTLDAEKFAELFVHHSAPSTWHDPNIEWTFESPSEELLDYVFNNIL